MLSRLVPALLGLLLVLSPSFAGELKQNPKAVLELFTSQGCSSCPPADRLLDELGQRPDVLALAYHVDYWDYIGWADTFGDEAHSDRQRAYAKAWKSPRIFTPQMVINGADNVVGSRRGDVGQAIADARLAVDVALAPEDNMLSISIPARAGEDEAVVWLVCFRDRADVAIERGENRGKTFAYTHIVMHRQVLGMWDPDEGAELKVPLKDVMPEGANGLAVLVQSEKDGLPGPILGAASYTH